MQKGRLPSIPPEAYGNVFMWYEQGFGYRRIAEILGNEGIFTTPGSVERLIQAPHF